jgi:hypothetical protein
MLSICLEALGGENNWRRRRGINGDSRLANASPKKTTEPAGMASDDESGNRAAK